MQLLKTAFLATALFATLGQAQITLTANRIPVPGDRIVRSLLDTTGVYEGSAGANQTWDFSSLAPTGDSTAVIYVDPSLTPAGSDFPQATVATEYIENGDSAYTYYIGSGTHFALLGMATVDMTVVYSNAEVLLTFPFSYNSEFGDISAASYQLDDDLRVERNGTIQAKAEGHGTIILPGGSAINALRVRIRQVSIDTTFFGTWPVFITTTEVLSYQWYDATHKFPVFGISYTEINSNGVTTRNKSVAMAAQSGMVDVREPAGERPEGLHLRQNFPNPFNPSTTIVYSLPREERVTLEVYNLIGQRVATLVEDEVLEAGSHEATFSAADLPSGVYLYTLTAGKEIHTRKLTLLK